MSVLPSQPTPDLERSDDFLNDYNPESYIFQNYARNILPEDRHVIDFVTRTQVIQTLGIQPRSLHKVVDIGNSAVFIPPGLMAPFVADDGAIHLCDVGHSQLHAIQKTINKGRRGHLGVWQKFEQAMAKNDTWHQAIQRACTLSIAEQKSIFDLEPDSFDAGSMFYCAESITADRNVMQQAAQTFLRSVRPGGLILWSGAIGSQGYTSPGKLFSATWIEPQDMLDIADEYVKDVHMTFVQASGGWRAYGPHYSGVGLLVGLRK